MSDACGAGRVVALAFVFGAGGRSGSLSIMSESAQGSGRSGHPEQRLPARFKSPHVSAEPKHFRKTPCGGWALHYRLRLCLPRHSAQHRRVRGAKANPARQFPAEKTK